MFKLQVFMLFGRQVRRKEMIKAKLTRTCTAQSYVCAAIANEFNEAIKDTKKCTALSTVKRVFLKTFSKSSNRSPWMHTCASKSELVEPLSEPERISANTPYPRKEIRRISAKSSQPFIFDIDGCTLEYGRDDFYLITGFRFGKMNLDPDEEDHSEIRMRVFPKIENLNGEYLLELVNKDVKFAKLDDEDVVRVCLLLALDFVFMGHELRHVVSKPIETDTIKTGQIGAKMDKTGQKREAFFYSENSTVNKLILSAIEMNELWWRSSLDYFKKVTQCIPVLRSATKGSSKGKSFHICVRIEVRHEVHVRTEVSRIHSKEESMGGVNQCMNVDEPYKNDVLDNFHVDGLDYKSVEGVSQCIGLNDEYESVSFDGLINLRSHDVGHLSKVQDACVSKLLDVVKDDMNVNSMVKEEIVKDDVNVNSLVKEDIEKDDVHVDSFVKEYIKKDDAQFDSVVKEAEQIENETLPRNPMLTGQWQVHIYVICFLGFNILFITLMVSNMVSPSLQDMFKRLSQNIPLEVHDLDSFALAYRERLIEFYWKYKMLPE
nr:phospholipase-like protein [Tanacetum cinerariifolium]